MNAREEEALLTELCEAAGKVGVKVSFEVLGGADVYSGGLCKVRGEWRLIGEKRAPTRDKIDLVAGALTQFELSGLTLSQQAREAIARGGGKGAGVTS